MIDRSTSSTPAPAMPGVPTGTDEAASRYPEHRPPHPLAITSVLATLAAVIAITVLAVHPEIRWWGALPTAASLVGALSGHLAIRRISRDDPSGRRPARRALFTGYLGLTVLVAETVLLVGILVLVASVIHSTGQ